MLTCYILHSRVRLYGFFHMVEILKCVSSLMALVLHPFNWSVIFAAPKGWQCSKAWGTIITLNNGMGRTQSYRYKSSSYNKNLIFGCHAMLNLNNRITFCFRKTCRAHLTIIRLLCILHRITLIIELLYNYTVSIQKIIVLFLFQIGTYLFLK